MSTPAKKSAAAQFGLPKVQTGSGFSTPKLVYPLIPGFDQEKSEKYWRQMGKILFAENIQTQLIPQGYIDLDKAYLESKNEKIVALKKTMGEACKSPYCRHKLWSGMLKLKNGDVSFKNACSNGSIQSFIWIVPYQYEKTLPDELKKQLSDLSSAPDVDIPAEIKAATEKYFEKGYPSMDCTIYYITAISEKITAILTEMKFGTDINAISQEDVVQCFIAGDFQNKPYKDKNGTDQPGWFLNVDDLWFFRPV